MLTLAALSLATLSGCVTPASPDFTDHDRPFVPAAEAQPPPSDTLPSETKPRPVQWTIDLPTYACASPGQTDPCSFSRYQGIRRNPFRVLPDNAASFNATLEWEPSTPSNEELRAAVFIRQACGENCWDAPATVAWSAGPSPLHVEGEFRPLGPGEEIVLLVLPIPIETQPLPVSVGGGLEQTVQVRGALTVQQSEEDAS